MRVRTLFALGSFTLGCHRAAPAPTATDSIDLVVAATTDVHGHVRGWDYFADRPDTLRGLARAATIVDSLRRTPGPAPILVDAGDMLQGTPLTYVAARIDTTQLHPVIAAMNAMHYDAAVIGNHEFNYGLPLLDRAAQQADFPLLASNAFTPASAPRFRGWMMLRRGPLRVAVVGATTPGSMLWDRDNLSGQVVIRDIVPSVQTAVAGARASGADIVIVVLHSGLDEPSSYDTVATHVPSENVAARIAHEVPGIDLIVYGHSHKQMADTTIGSTLLMQPRNWATDVAVAHLHVVRSEGAWRVTDRHSRLVATVHHRESKAVLSATERGHLAALRYARTPIATTSVAWRADSARVVDTPLIDFILDVERRASGAQLASTAAFSLDASIAPGPVPLARIAALYPYDNTLRAVRITGRELREYLEWSARYFQARPDGSYRVDPSIPGFNFDVVSGVEYTIDVSRPVGSRITKLEYAGRAVAPTDTFTMAVNNYRQSGGGGYAMLRDAPVVYDRQLEIRQLLIDEARRAGTLRPTDYFHPNWRIEPVAAIGPLYHSMQ